MGLWACARCGCRAIADGLRACPVCTARKEEEEEMPKITSGGPSSAWEEPAAAPVPEPEPVPVPEAAAPPAPKRAAPAAQPPAAAPKPAPPGNDTPVIPGAAAALSEPPGM